MKDFLLSPASLFLSNKVAFRDSAEASVESDGCWWCLLSAGFAMAVCINIWSFKEVKALALLLLLLLVLVRPRFLLGEFGIALSLLSFLGFWPSPAPTSSTSLYEVETSDEDLRLDRRTAAVLLDCAGEENVELEDEVVAEFPVINS